MALSVLSVLSMCFPFEPSLVFATTFSAGRDSSLTRFAPNRRSALWTTPLVAFSAIGKDSFHRANTRKRQVDTAGYRRSLRCAVGAIIRASITRGNSDAVGTLVHTLPRPCDGPPPFAANVLSTIIFYLACFRSLGKTSRTFGLKDTVGVGEPSNHGFTGTTPRQTEVFSVTRHWDCDGRTMMTETNRNPLAEPCSIKRRKSHAAARQHAARQRRLERQAAALGITLSARCTCGCGLAIKPSIARRYFRGHRRKFVGVLRVVPISTI
jgi:hypothetical protein